MEVRFIQARHERRCGEIGHHLNIDRNRTFGDLPGCDPQRERMHTEHIAPCGYSYARKYRTFNPGWPASMYTGQTFPGGYLRSFLSEHTEQIASCGHNNARKYQTFSPGLPASMRTGQTSPGRFLRSVIPEDTEQIAPCGFTTRVNTIYLAPGGL